jgi:hypothetical protein
MAPPPTKGKNVANPAKAKLSWHNEFAAEMAGFEKPTLA